MQLAPCPVPHTELTLLLALLLTLPWKVNDSFALCEGSRVQQTWGPGPLSAVTCFLCTCVLGNLGKSNSMLMKQAWLHSEMSRSHSLNTGRAVTMPALYWTLGIPQQSEQVPVSSRLAQGHRAKCYHPCTQRELKMHGLADVLQRQPTRRRPGRNDSGMQKMHWEKKAMSISSLEVGFANPASTTSDAIC